MFCQDLDSGELVSDGEVGVVAHGCHPSILKLEDHDLQAQLGYTVRPYGFYVKVKAQGCNLCSCGTEKLFMVRQ